MLHRPLLEGWKNFKSGRQGETYPIHAALKMTNLHGSGVRGKKGCHQIPRDGSENAFATRRVNAPFMGVSGKMESTGKKL